MKHIQDEAGFLEALHADRAVIFCHAEWSMPSVIGLNIFEEWAAGWLQHQANLSSVETWVAEPTDDQQSSLPEWLEQRGLGTIRSTGSAEVLWLERGQLVGHVYFLQSDPLSLKRVTLTVWPPTSPTD